MKKRFILTMLFGIMLIAGTVLAENNGNNGSQNTGNTHINIHPNIHNKTTINGGSNTNTFKPTNTNMFAPINTFSPKNTNTNLNTNINSNENKNTNLNTNINSNKAEQDQNQKQAQGQLQGQGQAQENVNILTFEDKREFVPSGNITYAPMPAYQGETPLGSSCYKATEVIANQKTFTIDEIDTILKDISRWDYDINTGAFNRGKFEGYSSITIYIGTVPDKKLILIGYDKIDSTDTDLDSRHLLFIAARKAYELGANGVIISGESWKRVFDSGGFGLSIVDTFSKILGATAGNTVAGGGGFNKGYAEYDDYPWIRVQYVRVETE